jgi:hypothetical protein
MRSLKAVCQRILISIGTLPQQADRQVCFGVPAGSCRSARDVGLSQPLSASRPRVRYPAGGDFSSTISVRQP